MQQLIQENVPFRHLLLLNEETLEGYLLTQNEIVFTNFWYTSWNIHLVLLALHVTIRHQIDTRCANYVQTYCASEFTFILVFSLYLVF